MSLILQNLIALHFYRTRSVYAYTLFRKRTYGRTFVRRNAAATSYKYDRYVSI